MNQQKNNKRGGKRPNSGAKKKEVKKSKTVQVRCTPDAYNSISERIKIYAKEEELRILRQRKGVEL